jgi:hypothetical protein
LESPKHLQQTTFENSKCIQRPCFETAYLGDNVIDLLNQKAAQNVAISLGYFIFPNIIMSLQK